MNMKKTIILLTLVAMGFLGCEKDDICDANTPTTPRLVIEFYDVTNPALLKVVTNLKVTGTGMDEPIIFNKTATGDEKYLISANKISLPLKINGDNTQYKLELNSGNSNPTLIVTDTLDFNYTRRTEYVSRACGYKTLFTLNAQSDLSSLPVVINNDPDRLFGNWIKNVQISESNIKSENETHIKIFF